MTNLSPKSFCPIGIAVWGIGDHARRTILPAIREVPDLDLVCIGSRNIAKVKKEAKRWGCSAVASLQELVDLANVKVVIVATPIGCHVADASKVLEAGKHLWCEKAFTEHLDDAIRLIEISRKRDLAICVSCPSFYHPLYRRLVSLLSNFAIGQIHAIDTHFGFPHVPVHSKYDPSFGGGALLDVGFHPLVVGASLLAESPVVESARLEKETGFNVDTAGTALLRFPMGAHLVSRWGYGRDYINEIRIFGQNGHITATPAFSKPPNLPLKMIIQRQDRLEDIAIMESNQFTAMLEEFARTVKDASLRECHRKKALDQQQLISQVQMFRFSK